MPQPTFTVQDVVLNAVENPKSFLLGSVLTEILRYREGGGTETLERASDQLQQLIGLEKSVNPHEVK